VKEARDEAKKEIDDYRKKKEDEFKKFEAEVCHLFDYPCDGAYQMLYCKTILDHANSSTAYKWKQEGRRRCK